MDMELSNLKTAKGKPLFLFNDKSYRINKQTESVTYYECVTNVKSVELIKTEMVT